MSLKGLSHHLFLYEVSLLHTYLEDSIIDLACCPIRPVWKVCVLHSTDFFKLYFQAKARDQHMFA